LKINLLALKSTQKTVNHIAEDFCDPEIQ